MLSIFKIQNLPPLKQIKWLTIRRTSSISMQKNSLFEFYEQSAIKASKNYRN